MLIIKQYRIYRKDLQANPGILYIFGDNLDREGFGGQAKEMRGEPNAFGIATKRSISHNFPDDYFFDHQDNVRTIITNEFLRLFQQVECQRIKGSPYKAIVLPSDGIGTGLSKLPEHAPKALEFINTQLEGLKDLI